MIVPVPGTTQVAHLEENLGASKVKLTASDMKEIEDGFAAIKVQGARTTDALRKNHDLGADLGTSSVSGHGNSPLPRR